MVWMTSNTKSSLFKNPYDFLLGYTLGAVAGMFLLVSFYGGKMFNW